MKTLTIILLATAVAGAQTVIEGHVDLPKTKTAPVMSKRYEIITKGGVLSTNPPVAIVYLEGSFPGPVSLPTRQIIQKDFMFSPTLLPVQTGTKVEFPNQDDAYHNVFSFSPAKRARSRRACAWAAATSEKVWYLAVGMPWRCMKALAKSLEIGRAHV